MRLLPIGVVALLTASSVMITPTTAAADSMLAANICDYVKADDKKRLRKKLKENRVKLRNIYSDLSCDGNSLLRTAMLSQSNKVGPFIAKRLSRKSLAEAEKDGQTVLTWAEGNGFGSSATASTIKEKTSS